MVLLMTMGKVTDLNAQNSSFEFWPETDIWLKLNPSWRLSIFAPLADYTNTGKSTDINVYLQADYAWRHARKIYRGRLFNENRAEKLKAWMVRGGVMRGWSFGENGDYHEELILAEIHKRVPLKERILLSQRFRPEFRWLGEDAEFSYRLRYRLMIEAEFTPGNWSVVPYINVEPYWDSRYTTINRVRLIGGSTVSMGPNFALESNLTYQYDEHYETSNLYSVNIILHVFFESKHAAPPPLEDITQ